MERNPQYCKIIMNRWEQFTGKKAEVISPRPQESGKEGFEETKDIRP
jgi:DNA modification methylase